MIEEKIVISDTNIFLDLIAINILDKFFLLPCDICTTDFVINEIEQPKQNAVVSKHIDTKNLSVVSFDFDELAEIEEMYNSSSISITDCSVWYYAKKTGGRLLTGDGRLRKVAESDKIKVSGILYIFDNLVEYGILDKTSATTLLQQLIAINSRLPKQECESRIEAWKE